MNDLGTVEKSQFKTRPPSDDLFQINDYEGHLFEALACSQALSGDCFLKIQM